MVSWLARTWLFSGIGVKVPVVSMVLLLAASPGHADDVIDVVIKGVDDGVRTSRQQDYNEALFNAKLQAIERAGVEIKSITEVVNLQVRFQMVEAKANAVLMPGFQVIDVGYTADGTYQVVLVGKVRVGIKDVQPTALIFLHDDYRLDGMRGTEFSGHVRVREGFGLGAGDYSLFAAEPKSYTLSAKNEQQERVVLRSGEVRKLGPTDRRYREEPISVVARAARALVEKGYGQIVVSTHERPLTVQVGNCTLEIGRADSWEEVQFLATPGRYPVGITFRNGERRAITAEVRQHQSYHIRFWIKTPPLPTGVRPGPAEEESTRWGLLMPYSGKSCVVD